MRLKLILLLIVLSYVPIVASAQDSPAAIADNTPVIVELGDSLSAAYGMEISQSWPSLLQEHLSEHGYAHRVFNSSITGDTTQGGLARLPRMLDKHQPDVVILDLRMAGLDGFQVCKTIKADPNTAKTLVIAITGYHTPETEARILECGAVRCFAKPVDLATLSSFITAELERQGGSRPGRGRSARA